MGFADKVFNHTIVYTPETRRFNLKKVFAEEMRAQDERKTIRRVVVRPGSSEFVSGNLCGGFVFGVYSKLGEHRGRQYNTGL